MKITYFFLFLLKIVLDGNFIFHCLKYNVEIKDRLRKTLQGEEVILYITRSSLNELHSVGERAKTSYEYALQCCLIIEEMEMNGETPADKLLTYLGYYLPPIIDYLSLFFVISIESIQSNSNKKNFIVATQDKDLRMKISRAIPGIPLLYLNQGQLFFFFLILPLPLFSDDDNNNNCYSCCSDDCIRTSLNKIKTRTQSSQ